MLVDVANPILPRKPTPIMPPLLPTTNAEIVVLANDASVEAVHVVLLVDVDIAPASPAAIANPLEGKVTTARIRRVEVIADTRCVHDMPLALDANLPRSPTAVQRPLPYDTR